jgi:hypothetical protein
VIASRPLQTFKPTHDRGPAVGNRAPPLRVGQVIDIRPEGSVDMRGILLWVLGIPIPAIILLYLFHVI